MDGSSNKAASSMKALEERFSEIVEMVGKNVHQCFPCANMRQAWRIKTRFYVYRKAQPADSRAHDISVGIRKTEGDITIEFYLSNDLTALSFPTEQSSAVREQGEDEVLESFFAKIDRERQK